MHICQARTARRFGKFLSFKILIYLYIQQLKYETFDIKFGK